MSAKTKQAMEDAMASHFADEMDGAIQTGYWLIVKGSDMDRPDTTSYHHTGPDIQPFHESLGLVQMTRLLLEEDYRESQT